jgi:hypothetical protein
MPDFLPLGFRCVSMIVAGFSQSTGRMGRAHVIRFVLPSQLQGPDVLDDPTLADAINGLITEDTDAFGLLPNGKPHPWREPRPPCRPEI